MGGKASLILVLGFSIIFLVMGLNYGNLSSSASDNMVSYAKNHFAYYNAYSAANMVLGEIRRSWVNNSTYDIPNKIDFGNAGTAKITTDMTYYSNLDTSRTNYILLRVQGEFEDSKSTIEVKYNRGNFARFAYFSDSEGSNIWWTNNDTVTGPFHTNADLLAYRKPRFLGPETTYGGNIRYWENSYKDAPNVSGTFERKYIPMNFQAVSEFEALASSGGKVFDNGDSKIYLQFMEESVKYWTQDDPPKILRLDSLAPNGCIFVKNAELHISGIIKGRYSVSTSGSVGYNLSTGKLNSSPAYGNVIIDDDIQYHDAVSDNLDWDNMSDPSLDMLGIIAEQNVLISKDFPNKGGDININAAIYCQNGGFGVEDYSNFPASGEIKLRGGITQKIRRAVGQFGSYPKGFSKDYYYDKRLLVSNPPNFPSSTDVNIISWLE